MDDLKHYWLDVEDVVPRKKSMKTTHSGEDKNNEMCDNSENDIVSQMSCDETNSNNGVIEVSAGKMKRSIISKNLHHVCLNVLDIH